MEAIMNLKGHHTTQELKTLYRTEKNAAIARRIHGVYLAAKGLSCTQITTITGVARRKIQQWVHKYNKHGIDGLKDKPRPGQRRK
jgi:putative transposase